MTEAMFQSAAITSRDGRSGFAPVLEFGGIKQSGINRYRGKAGLRLFSNIKSMVIGDGKQDTEAYWFPHGEGTLQAVKESLR